MVVMSGDGGDSTGDVSDISDDGMVNDVSNAYIISSDI